MLKKVFFIACTYFGARCSDEAFESEGNFSRMLATSILVGIEMLDQVRDSSQFCF